MSHRQRKGVYKPNRHKSAPQSPDRDTGEEDYQRRLKLLGLVDPRNKPTLWQRVKNVWSKLTGASK